MNGEMNWRRNKRPTQKYHIQLQKPTKIKHFINGFQYVSFVDTNYLPRANYLRLHLSKEQFIITLNYSNLHIVLS